MGDENQPGFFAGEPTMVGRGDATLPVQQPQTVDAAADPDQTLQRGSAATLASGGAPPIPPPPVAPLEGKKIFGDYELVEMIARGGMGVVYKARQRKLNRIVAIKMILAGQFADQHEIDRFYAEAEAAANLRHANIVGIHEIGEVDGQHFFSMDFIEGKSLADIVRDNPLAPRQAAEYVRCISETMQFAHDRGILHRDLKPSNILVDHRDEPLITDFGLAKQVSGQSQLTVTGAIVGTPSYMPPEQAAGKHDKTGPHSDIYSLGAILYELITGRPPFRAATPFETIRHVLEVEPVSPRLINPGIPRDLETICLKCLQKETGRRYSTARELAEELSRFLSGEPILARPLGRLTRAWRWCRRYPWLATAFAIAAVCLCIAIVGLSVGWYQSTLALERSRKSAKDQLEVVNQLVIRVSEDTLLNQPGMQPVRESILRDALAYYQRLLKEGRSDPELKNEMADAYFRIGVITEALGANSEALKQYGTARQMQLELLQRNSQEPARLSALGNTLNALGKTLTVLKQYPQAITEYRAAIGTRTQLVEVTRRNAEQLRVLANTYMNLGLVLQEQAKIEDARAAFNTAQKLRTEALQQKPQDDKLQRDFAKGEYNLGTLLAIAEKKLEPAKEKISRAAATLDQLLKSQPDNLETQHLSAICHMLLGDISIKQKLADEARSSYERARQRLAWLTESNPAVTEYRLEYAGLLMSIGELERKYGTLEEEGAAFSKACELLQALVANYPADPRPRFDLALALFAYSEQQIAVGENEGAIKNLQAARGYLMRLREELPSDESIPPTLEAIEELLNSTEAPST